jgi:PHP family Zn ribbon phosphoesterase
MSPRALVAAAREKGLDMIAVSDHNSAENAAAVIRAAGLRPMVIPGLEICTVEEVHVLGLFETVHAALSMQDLVYQRLTDQPHRPDLFGDQVVVNEEDDVLGFVDRMLIGAVSLDLTQVVAAIHERGGLAVASHVDRPMFGLLAVLGFVPENPALDALELSRRVDPGRFLAERPDARGHPLIRSSDAHHPDQVGLAWTEFELESPTFREIRMALKGENGRRIHALYPPPRPTGMNAAGG